MGRIGPVVGIQRASAEDRRSKHSTDCLRGDGALAGVAGDRPDRRRYDATRKTTAVDGRTFLIGLLGPLHADAPALACRLYDHFGSLAAIAEAPDDDLRRVTQKKDDLIEAFLVVRRLLSVALRERVNRTRMGDDPVGFSQYLLSIMRGLKAERLLAFFCADSGYLISEERLADGQEGSLNVSIRRLLARALALDAKRVILAHNHPSGSAEPSEQDIRNTRLFGRLAREVDIVLDDHFVVGRHEVISMKDRGLF